MATVHVETNLTAVLIKPNDLRLQWRKMPEPGPHDVLVRIQRVGICGSDVHYWHRGSSGRFVVKEPLVLGHESSGVVVKIGSGVTQLAVGDRVALEPGVPCRSCDYCKTGRYNLCAGIRFCATPPVDGTLCEYFVHPADFCFRLPDHVSLESAALLEPLAVAVYSVQRCDIRMGDAVLVLGAGPVGLLSLLAAKSAGATQVAITENCVERRARLTLLGCQSCSKIEKPTLTVPEMRALQVTTGQKEIQNCRSSDVNADRLQFAKKLGADSIHLITADKTLDQVAQEIARSLGRRPTAALECSGAESSIRLALHALERRGIMATVGRGPYDVTIPSVEIVSKELEVRGIFRYANCYPAALQLVTSGRLHLDQLVTHHFSLDQVEQAFQTALTGEAIKVMIDVESTTSETGSS